MRYTLCPRRLNSDAAFSCSRVENRGKEFIKASGRDAADAYFNLYRLSYR